MRRFLFTMMAVGLLALLFLLVAQHRNERAYLKWDYDYAHDVPCTDTRTKNCVRGFNIFVGGPSSSPKPMFVANCLDEKGRLITKSISATVNFKRFGNVQFCVTAVGVDATGAAVESRPMCVLKFVIPFLGRDVRVNVR